MHTQLPIAGLAALLTECDVGLLGRNWRFVDVGSTPQVESALIRRVTESRGRGVLNVEAGGLTLLRQDRAGKPVDCIDQQDCELRSPAQPELTVRAWSVSI
jgi:hypothetical protein